MVRKQYDVSYKTDGIIPFTKSTESVSFNKKKSANKFIRILKLGKGKYSNIILSSKDLKPKKRGRKKKSELYMVKGGFYT